MLRCNPHLSCQQLPVDELSDGLALPIELEETTGPCQPYPGWKVGRQPGNLR